MFNIPPGKVADVRASDVPAVWKSPIAPDIPYELVTLDSVLKKPELTMMLEEFAAGKFDQPVAQLAAWHFSNGLDMNALANTGYAPGRLSEVARVIQYIQDKAKAVPATKPRQSGAAAMAERTSPGKSSQP